jgi:DNA-binding NarL/FixJ family response regulator
MLEQIPNVTVTAEAQDGMQAIAAVDQHRPELILLDLNMPNMPGLDALSEIRSRNVPAIVLTVRADKRDIVQAVQLGARAFLQKSDAVRYLTSAVASVISGRCWFVDREVANPSEFLDGLPAPVGNVAPPLGPRELQVVQLVAQGLSNREISQRIAASEQVVKNILTAVFNKLGVFNRVELALYAIDHGWVRR